MDFIVNHFNNKYIFVYFMYRCSGLITEIQKNEIRHLRTGNIGYLITKL